MSPVVVQSAQNSGNDSGGNPSVTVTLGSPATAGNCLVVVAATGAQSVSPAVSAVTLGGAADHFGSLVQAGTAASFIIVSFWADPGCAGGQSSVAVTTAGGSGGAWMTVSVLEVSGLASSLGALLDQDAGTDNGNAATASFSSGATAATAQASELWVGSAGTWTTPVITGPGSPWTLLAQETAPALSGTTRVSSVTGYQVTSATGAASYAGTMSGSTQWTAGVVTLKAAGAGPAPALLTASGLA